MIPSVSASRRTSENLVGILVFLAAFAASLWFTHLGWNNKLLDTHPFRQTQTALSAYWMLHDGVKLDYATPVMGAPWSIPMEFPFYQAVVTKVVKATGLPLESAGRAVSLAFFYLALPAVWLLLRRLGISSLQRWLFLALVLVSPVYLFYSRTFLIESTALCFAVWFLHCFHVSLDDKRTGAIVAAALLGVATGLAKVTTYAVFLAPAAAFALNALRVRTTSRRALILRGSFAALPGVIAAAWWVFYTDAVKRLNVFGESLTSAAQQAWNYGPFSLRFTPAFWQQFGVQVERAILPVGTALVLIITAALFLRGRGKLFAITLVVALAGPLVFTNLYYVHDYYLYSSGLLFLAVVALPFKQLLDRVDFPFAARIAVVLLALGTQFSGYLRTYYKPQITAETEAPELARAIRHVTQPTDVLVGFGMHFSSILPYYSERRAMMVPDAFSRDDAAIAQALEKLGSLRVAMVILFRLTQPEPAFFAPWLQKLAMDETPFLQTGEYTVHIRKDMLPDALKALAEFPLKDVLLYEGRIARAGEKPPLVFWTDQLADRTPFSMMSPQPVKVTVPFGLGAEPVEGRLGFAAHTPTVIEITSPAGARTIRVEFGLNPDAYERSDGVEFEIVLVRPNASTQRLYHRHLQPAVLNGDRGPQSVVLEPAGSLEGTLLFRTLPGGSPNFDWAYWSKISVE
ncbi:MAG TPA: hypothetical protein VL069_01880 [Opitutus sp.]|nr:hypothetical protein [Opitutus sp.]